MGYGCFGHVVYLRARSSTQILPKTTDGRGGQSGAYRLINWHIDDMRRDTRGDYEIAKALVLEDGAGVFGAVEDAVDWEEGSRGQQQRTTGLQRP